MNAELRKYSFDELWESNLDDFYLHYEEFAALLCKALEFVPVADADKILSSTFFIPFYGDSWHFCRELIRERDVVIIDGKDLDDEQEAIVTILHEAGHSFLRHVSFGVMTEEEKRSREDECWNQVRKWLPANFTPYIDRAERLGSASRGVI